MHTTLGRNVALHIHRLLTPPAAGLLSALTGDVLQMRGIPFPTSGGASLLLMIVHPTSFCASVVTPP